MTNKEFNYRFHKFMFELTPQKQEEIKLAIGDSTNNNRTVTVNQVVRYLTRKNASATQRKLGKKLNFYKSAAFEARCNRNFYYFSIRTDAVDINELYEGLVNNNG